MQNDRPPGTGQPPQIRPQSQSESWMNPLSAFEEGSPLSVCKLACGETRLSLPAKGTGGGLDKPGNQHCQCSETDPAASQKELFFLPLENISKTKPGPLKH